MRLSNRDYLVLKNAHDPYIQMCGLKTLQKYNDSLVPNTQSFLDTLTYLIAGDARLFISKDFPPSTALLEPPCLFDLGLFSSLPSY